MFLLLRGGRDLDGEAMFPIRRVDRQRHGLETRLRRALLGGDGILGGGLRAAGGENRGGER
jgi:hypothetical protein